MNLEVPIPPRPSNRDRYILWKKRNIERRVIDQTDAVLYLQSKGYKYNIHYEAYQAIDLATELRRTNNEPQKIDDESKNFNEVYTLCTRNFLSLEGNGSALQRPAVRFEFGTSNPNGNRDAAGGAAVGGAAMEGASIDVIAVGGAAMEGAAVCAAAAKGAAAAGRSGEWRIRGRRSGGVLKMSSYCVSQRNPKNL